MKAACYKAAISAQTFSQIRYSNIFRQRLSIPELQRLSESFKKQIWVSFAISKSILDKVLSGT